MRDVIFVAVRRPVDGGEEFLDLSTSSFHLEGCRLAADHTAKPHWRERNPVARFGRFEINEVEAPDGARRMP